MIIHRLISLALPLTLLPFVGGAAPARAPFPQGSYDSDAYTLTFDGAGTFRYVKDTALMVEGSYVVHDSTIAMTDLRGRDACVGADHNPGTYRWRVVDGALWFRTVADPCPARIQGLADQAWRPHHAH